jgi:hypothetical protein
VETQENRYAVSLADYRHLYQTYLSDPHLQEARARWPFICIWDDHEFANDNFQSFSTYGGEHVLDARRKQSSSQAWFEYIPSVLNQLAAQPAHDFRPQELDGDESARNRAALDSLRIYRQLSWGKYLDIVLTDSRSYRSPPCLPKDFAKSLGLPMNTVQLVEIADAGSAYAGLKYMDTTANGYGLASFSADELQVQLITMEDCRPDFVQAPAIRHVAKFRMAHWQRGEQPVLEGPEFEGGAPFPFDASTV